MTILSIDQSYNACAYVVDDNKQMVEFGCLISDKTQDIYKRALDISLKLDNIYTKYYPTEIRLEGLAFGMRGDATRDLAGLLFTIINVISLKHSFDNFKIISPKTVKKSATGSGKATKKDMIAALPKDIKQKFTDANYKQTTGLADLADAFWISQV
jgi:Holliday junction resolvasome RuvABC endonuclease subunit